MYSFTKNTGLKPQITQTPSAFPIMSTPSIIGSYSTDGIRCYMSDARNCKYLRKLSANQQVEFDLNIGLENFVSKPRSDRIGRNDNMFQFILQNLAILRNKNEGESTNDCFLSKDIVCARNVLRFLIRAPYEYLVGWCILATKFKGTIYLTTMENDLQLNERLNRTEKMNQIISYGFKFQQYMLADGPSEVPNTDAPVVEAESFYCIFTITVEGHSILYSCEMDVIESDVKHDLNKIDLNKLKFIELKVQRRIATDNQRKNYYKFKLLEWWSQCYLANIEKIIVGTRSEDGIVREITELSPNDFPEEAKTALSFSDTRDYRYWSPEKSLKFCTNFFKLLKDEMHEVDNPHTVYKFDYNPSQNTEIQVTAYENGNKLGFVPDWFIEEIQRR